MQLQSLHLRFMVIVIAGATLFAAAAGAMVYRFAHARSLDAGRQTINSLVDAVEKTAAAAAYTSDALLMKEVLNGLTRSPLVAGAEVRAPDGKVLARQSEELLAAGGVDGDAASVERRLASPFDGTETVGVLRISADGTRIEADARAEAFQLALLMIGQTALVALLLYVVAARFVSRPIVQVGRQLGAMQPGTADRLQVPSGHAADEIGALISSANHWLDLNEQALQRERALRAEIEAMEAQYRQIFDSSSAGIFVLDADGRLINTNPTALRVIGRSRDQLRQLGSSFVPRVFARPLRVREMIDEAAERGETVSNDLELVGGEAEHTRWVHCLLSVQNGAGKPRLIEGVMYDVTDRKRAERAVLHRAEHDALTGLKNRPGAVAAIDRFIGEAQANDSTLTLLYIDLDGFKQINDRYGHKAGDQVLIVCAQRMLANVRRTSDIIGRLGGDEFVIVLNQVGSADSAIDLLARNLVAALGTTIVLEDGRLVSVGASVGIASFPRHGTTRAQLLHAADQAMYEVKRSGKNAFAMALAAPALA